MADQTPASTPFIYDGKLGEIYKIFLLNIFLGIITLGIYRFWGKTRIRRYLASSYLLHSDRFEYTGFGKELFLGSVKALIFLLIVSIPLIYSIIQIERSARHYEQVEKQLEQENKRNKSPESLIQPTANPIDQAKTDQKVDLGKIFNALSYQDKHDLVLYGFIIIAYIIFYYCYLPYVAVFAALRYRATRMQWRGIRGFLSGSALIYGIIGMINLLLSICTLGLWLPFSDLFKLKYQLNHLYFGDQKATFIPTYGRLFVSNILTGLLSIIFIIICIAGFSLFINATLSNGKIAPGDQAMNIINLTAYAVNPPPSLSIVPIIVLIILLIICFLPRFWYRATLRRIQYNNLHFGDIGFQCRMNGWNLAKQTIGNYLILIFTLGIGTATVFQRRLRYFSQNVTVTGDLDKIALQQSTGKMDKTGEGLLTAFALDIRLF